MTTVAKPAFIRQKAIEGKVRWTRHALSALAAETVSVRDVEVALRHAEVIEVYPHLHRCLPDCLILTFAPPHRPIHCVVAVNEPEDYVLIVTVYEPTEKEWKDDWRARR